MAAAASFHSAFQPYLSTCKLVNVHSDPSLMAICSQIFRSNFEGVYGPQERAVRKIQEGRNKCLIALNTESQPVGILVHKSSLSQKYAQCGLGNSLKIKTLLIIDPKTLRAIDAKDCKYKQVIQLQLLNEAFLFAKSHKAKFIHVTVRKQDSVEDQNFFELFQKNGFIFSLEVLEQFSKKILIKKQSSGRSSSLTRDSLGYDCKALLAIQKEQQKRKMHQLVTENQTLQQQYQASESQIQVLTQENQQLANQNIELSKTHTTALEVVKKIDVVTGGGTIVKIVGKLAGELILEEGKIIPFISIPVGIALAWRRYYLYCQSSEKTSKWVVGAKMITEVASGVIACFPGTGTAIAVGMDATLGGSDLYEARQVQKSVMNKALTDAYKKLDIDIEENPNPTKEEVEQAYSEQMLKLACGQTNSDYARIAKDNLIKDKELIYRQRGWNTVNQCALL